MHFYAYKEHDLKDVLDIISLKARYVRCVDTQDYDGLRTIFADDAFVEYPQDYPEMGPIHMPYLMDFIIEGLKGAKSMHHASGPEIEILSKDRAKGIWSVRDEIIWDKAGPGGLKHLWGWAHYHEEYIRRDDRWRIQSYRFERIWSERKLLIQS